MITIPPSRLVQLYERGVLTRIGAISRLVQAAAASSPEDIAVLLDSEWLVELRSETSHLPGSRDGVVWIESVCAGPDFDWEKHRAEMTSLWFEGAWNWHRYFAAAADAD